MRSSSILSLVILIVSIFFRCTLDYAGGPGSGSETTNSITIAAAYPDGTPAAGAVVRVRHASYLPDQSTSSQSTTFRADTITDSSGSVILKIDTGIYMIETNDSRGNASIVTQWIKEEDSAVVSPVLKKTGEITGRIDMTQNFPNATVQVFGIERTAKVDSTDGTFIINDLPEGAYSIRLYSPGQYYIAPVICGILVSEGLSTDIGEVTLSWPFAQIILLNTTTSGASVSETQTGFPVAIRLNAFNFNFFFTKQKGEIIRFVKNGDTLAHEVELWDVPNYQALIWVHLDTIAGNDTTEIIMYWGNTTAAENSNAQAVFDTSAGFQAVWHQGSTENEQISDATLNGYHAVPENIGTESFSSGILGKSLAFPGDGAYRVPGTAGSSLNFGESDTFTISAWVKTDLLDSEYHEILSKGKHQYGLQINKVNHWVAYEFREEIGVDTTHWPAISQMWTHVTAVFSGSNQYLYINGTLADSTIGTLLSAEKRIDSLDVVIGRSADTLSSWFKGKMDEIRISNRARSSSWIKLCYENQRELQKLVLIKR